MMSHPLRRWSEHEARHNRENSSTRLVMRSELIDAYQPFDPRPLFIEHYPRIRKALTKHPSQGLSILAFRRSQFVGEVWRKAVLDKTEALIIGRHLMADLAIPDSEELCSLRHALVLMRAISHTEVRIRLLDLRSQIGFGDEAGRTLRAVWVEGTAFFQIGETTLMLLVTGDPDQPELPATAYSMIPERICIEEQEMSCLGADRRELRRLVAAQPGGTLVRSVPGVLSPQLSLCEPDESPIGELTLMVDSQAERSILVGLSALRRGILLGRYGRCDFGLPDDFSRISRVHLLLGYDDEPIAVDTASTNGTFHGKAEVRLLSLGDSADLNLADQVWVRWRSR